MNSTHKKKRKGNSNLRWMYVLAGFLLVGALGAYLWKSIQDLRTLSFADSLGLDIGKQREKRSVIESTLIIFDEPTGDASTIEGHIQHAYQIIWNTEESAGVVVEIPGWLYIRPSIELSEEYIAVGDIKYAHKVFGAEDLSTVINQFESITAVGIDRYLWVDGEAARTYSNIFGGLPDTDDSGAFLVDFLDKFSLGRILFATEDNAALELGIHTNMSPTEVYSQIQLIESLYGGDELGVIPLYGRDFYEQGNLSSGTEINILKLNALDLSMSGYYSVLRSRDIEKEQAKIEVFNGGAISGLASSTARLIENNGIKVVRAGNSPDLFEVNTIYVADLERFELSLARVKTVLGYGEGDCVVIEGRPSFLTTGDIVVIPVLD